MTDELSFFTPDIATIDALCCQPISKCWATERKHLSCCTNLFEAKGTLSNNLKKSDFCSLTQSFFCEKSSIECCLLVDLCEPFFEYVDSHDPGMPICETTRNKGFKMISNRFIYFCAFLDQEYQYFCLVQKKTIF